MSCLKLKHHLLFILLILVVALAFLSFPSIFTLHSFPSSNYSILNHTLVITHNKVKRTTYLHNYDRLAGLHDKHSRTPVPALPPTSHHPSPNMVISVDDYLTSSSSTSHHTKAFRKAWKKACSTRGGVFLVPKNKVYKVKQIKFSGPCHPHFTIKILGTVKASTRMSDYKDRRYWLVFENVHNLKVQGGGGTLDGMGHIWWKNSCKINRTLPCRHAPTAVTFLGCNKLRVEGLRIRNAQQMQLSFQKCGRVKASNLVITAPKHSPNTDGIHVTETSNILITNSLVQTGDDCISIVSGSKNVVAKGIRCGPGHGISIGSLGKGQSLAQVSNVMIDKATISGTSNGVRIKTWQGGRGYAKNIVFKNIMMRNVSNPIIIDQHYCDQPKPCHDMKNGVQVKNVVYKNIVGTSASKVAVKLDCSKRHGHGCAGIVLENVKLVRSGHKQGGEARAVCHNVHYFLRGNVSPTCSSSQLMY